MSTHFPSVNEAAESLYSQARRSAAHYTFSFKEVNFPSYNQKPSSSSKLCFFLFKAVK